VTDPRGAYVEPQPHWQAYTGQTWEEHKEFGWIDAVHPEDRDRLLEAWARARDARELHEFSGRLWHASSAEYRHFTVKATPFVDSDGVVRGWVGACTDVHEAVRSAEALREADRRKDEFLATLAHELRNPLAPIRNSLHVLRLAGSDASKMERVHEMMDRQVKHMVRLVDDLMEVSRITRGKIELRKERVELATIVRSSVETSKPLIDAGGHSLDIDVPSGPITLDADPIRIAQVLANLLNNAAKYTPRGGQIELKAEKRGAFIHVSVRDNGIGIPSEHLPEVFELFTQVDRSSGHSKGGLGIGLTLARSLVELHGGSVTASSDGAGYGSEFTVTIPIAEEVSAVASASSRIVSERRLPRRRILVVDDNRDAADSLAMLLEHLAAEVRVANDGSAALDAIRTFQPSVILLDIDMPKMNGYEVARRARSESSGRGAVIVALTGWGQEEDRRRSVDAGIDHHLVKPVDLDVLRDLLAGIPAED
jgi:two-component system CheB/CheR fusion protein